MCIWMPHLAAVAERSKGGGRGGGERQEGINPAAAAVPSLPAEGLLPVVSSEEGRQGTFTQDRHVC